MFKFLSFEFNNYKGIKQLTFTISGDNNKPYCLVGDNEAGKTTILKGIEQICKLCAGEHLENGDLHRIKPIGVSFSDSVILKATLKYTGKPNPDLFKELGMKQSGVRQCLVDVEFKYDYEASAPKPDDTSITINGKRFDEVPEEIKDGIPSFVYYDDFCFNVPDYVDFSQKTGEANLMWQRIFDNVLSMSTDGVLNSFEEAVVNFSSDDPATVANRLDTMIDTLDERISKVWAYITRDESAWFKFYISPKPGDSTKYVLQIKEGNTTFPLNVRSKGFKWFICFVLMSEIRSGGNKDKSTIFLLDEPANNMHLARLDTIQDSLLKVAKDSRSCIIFSTHSPGLINYDYMNVKYCLGKGIGTVEKETSPVNIQLTEDIRDSGELNALLSVVSDIQKGYNIGIIKSKIKEAIKLNNIKFLSELMRLGDRVWSLVNEIGT